MLFPIKDYNPTQRTAYLTIVLIAVNILVFLFQVSDLEVQIARHAMIPWEVTHLETIEKPMGYILEKEAGIPVLEILQ